MLKPSRVKVVVHLKSGKSLNAWIAENETVEISNLKDSTIWHFGARYLFASDIAKYILLGSQIDYIEVL